MIQRTILNLRFFFFLAAWKKSSQRDLKRYAKYRADLDVDQRRLSPKLVGLELRAYKEKIETLETLTSNQIERANFLRRTCLSEYTVAELKAFVEMLQKLSRQTRTGELIEVPSILRPSCDQGVGGAK